MSLLRRLLLLIVALGVLPACSTTRSVSTSDLRGARFVEVNQDVRGKVVDIELADGREVRATSVLVGPDTTTYFNIERGRLRHVPTSSIREISAIRAARGALVGLGAGIVTGVAVGLIRASTEGDDPANDPFGATQQEKFTIYPAAHSAYNSLALVPLGAIIGVRQRYRFERPRPAREPLAIPAQPASE